jgi:N-acetyl-alpha-D-muramate 1-phosphate uridylyltransferase
MHSRTAMDAMIFAAGLGTRLRPITDRTPKPLLPVGGVPVLERVARRLIAAGADRLIVNVHHHARQIERFVDERDGFGVEVVLSHEDDQPLETGGGLLHAAHHFRRSAPFFLHNGDVLSDAPLGAMYAHHAAGDAVATLAVLPARAERYLLFDDGGLCGYARRDTGEDVYAREPRGTVERREFAGIHVASPSLLDALHGGGAFSIVPTYMKLSAGGRRIAPFSIEGAHWFDVGSFERLAEADRVYAGEGVAGQ